MLSCGHRQESKGNRSSWRRSPAENRLRTCRSVGRMYQAQTAALSDGTRNRKMKVFPLPGREALIPKGNRSTREVARHGRCLQQVELTAKPLFIDYSSSRLSASTACLRHPPRPVCRPGMPGDQNASSSGWFTDAVRNGNARQQRFRTQTGVSALVSPLSRKAFSAMFAFGRDGSFPSAERKNPSPGPKCRPESCSITLPLPKQRFRRPAPGTLTTEQRNRSKEQANSREGSSPFLFMKPAQRTRLQEKKGFP